MANKGWQTHRLGDVCSKIGSGATPRGGKDVYLSSGDIALIRSQNVYNNHFTTEGLAFLTEKHADELSNVIVEPGDILLNITGDSVARCTQVPTSVLPARVNQHVAIIRPDSGVLDTGFLRYFLVSPQMQDRMLGLAAAGATRNALTKGMIEGFAVPAPTITIQRRIADILGTLDDKIELNRRMNETLEAMARRLFKSWFIDFDPVHAKAALRREHPKLSNADLSRRALPKLSPEIAELFPDSFEDSTLGPIPNGWKATTVGEDFSLTMGQSPPGSTYNEIGEGLPFYQGKTDFQTRFPDRRIYCTAPTRYAKRLDTLVSVRAPVGAINMAREDCAIGRGIAAIRHNSGSSSYTYYAMEQQAEAFQRFEAEGTVFGSINKSNFENLSHVAPAVSVVNAFDALVAKSDEMMHKVTLESESLESARNKLLPRLLSGELSVTAEGA